MCTTNRVSLGALLAFGLVAAACAPGENHRGREQAPLSGGRPTLHSNLQRYRVSGQQPATGRSGSASIEAFALLGRDGTTDVVVTTAPPGVLAHVQIKIFDGAGAPAQTDNFEVDTSEAHFAYANLARGQALQVQASVRDLDGNRTDVVTETTRVAARPDLAVTSLSVPASVGIGEDVSIAAIVAELNGDVGAHADCVLSVDGAEADRATGIWIDAGSSVTCRFLHRFDQAGTHALRLAATGVVPADWDLSNNSLDGSIAIGGQRPIQYQAQAQENQWQNAHHIDAWQTWPAPSQDLLVDEQQSGWQQSRTFNGSLPVAVAFPVAAFDITDATDGTPIAGMHATDIGAASSWGDPQNGGACAWLYGDQAFASICTQWSFGWGQTTLSAFRDAGDVSYHSEGYARYWGWYFAPGMTFVGGYWVWNSSTETQTGPQVRLGSTYSLDVVLDAGESWAAHTSFPLSAFSGGWDQPYTCYAFMANGRWCESISNRTSGVSGWASGP